MLERAVSGIAQLESTALPSRHGPVQEPASAIRRSPIWKRRSMAAPSSVVPTRRVQRLDLVEGQQCGMTTTMAARRTAGSRNVWVRLATSVLPVMALLSAGTAMAVTVVDESKTLSSAVDPIERDFDIASSGTGKYKVTLTDLGAQLPTGGVAQRGPARHHARLGRCRGAGRNPGQRTGLAHRHAGVRCDTRQVLRACRRHSGAG